MAEPISVAASLVTLVGAVRVAVQIVRQVSEAPKQIDQIARDLEDLAIQLELLQDVQNFTDHASSLTSTVYPGVQTSLERNIVEFKAIASQLRRIFAKYKTIKGRVCWLLVGKDETLSLTNRLQEMRNSLNLMLNLLTLALNLSYLASTKHQEPFHGRGLQADHGTDTPVSVAPGSECTLPVHKERFEGLQRFIWPQNSKSSTVFRTEFMLPTVGRIAASFHHAMSTTSRYELAFWLALPYSRMFTIRLLLSGHSWLRFNIENSFQLYRVVDDNSALHEACASGNTLEIKRLLLECPAAIEDRTPQNWSPLRMAIQSRNCDAVKLLLEHGADVNSLFGKNQTSALAWATQHRHAEIVRLLLTYDADCHHITSYGWTPLFYLWWGDSNQFDFVDQAESILQILASRSDFRHTYAGVTDTLDFAAIHMAVMRGTIPQIRFLLHIDPRLVQVKGFRGWTAVHVAVSEGRLDMLKLLLPYYDRCEILSSKDERGWTLLHTSAAEGGSDVTKYLLQIGADWQALSSPSTIEVPLEVKGRSCTPLEAASAECFERRITFLKDVREVCGEGVLAGELLEELSEKWIDAMSIIV